LERGEKARLPAKTSAYQQWAQALQAYAESEQLQSERGYWMEQAQSGSGRLLRDYELGANTVGSAARVVVELSEEETQALLQEAPKAYRTQINDVLLTALAASLGQWSDEGEIVVELEGHGREEVANGVDVTRTVGWFTSIYPVRLRRAAQEGEWGKRLQAMKEQLRAIPQNGIGYGLLRYLKRSEELCRSQAAEVSFNYLGQLDQIFDGEGIFAPGRESSGASSDASQIRPYVLNINSKISGRRLQAVWTYSRNLHRQETIERMAQAFIQALREILIHAKVPDSVTLTPADFPLAQVDQRQLRKLLNQIRETPAEKAPHHATAD
jgi:non-ribosomal peptide synthase protein (TIGR01720 family)